MTDAAINIQAESVQTVKGLKVGNHDGWLVFAVVSLLSMGTVMVFSATIAGDIKTLDTNFDHLIRHLMHIGMGAIILWAVSSIRMDWLEKSNKVWLLFGLLACLALVFSGLGVEVNGSRRWINLIGIQLQPAEFVKVAAVIYFADYLAKKKDGLHLFKVGVVNIGLVVGVIGLLLLLQPDFGTTVVITCAVAIMMFLAGVRFLHLSISISVATGLMAMIMWMAPYRAERLLSHRDPWADPFGAGFQLVQSLIALGRGEWFGAGLGSSIQKFSYLPHAGNDFLIAIIGEELGVLGIFCVLMLFVLLLFRTFVIAQRAFQLDHRFSGFLAQGTGVIIALQAAVHIGVNIGWLPTKGLTLPMMSYGGSSMVSNMVAIGLLFAIERQVRLQIKGRR